MPRWQVETSMDECVFETCRWLLLAAPLVVQSGCGHARANGGGSRRATTRAGARAHLTRSARATRHKGRASRVKSSGAPACKTGCIHSLPTSTFTFTSIFWHLHILHYQSSAPLQAQLLSSILCLIEQHNSQWRLLYWERGRGARSQSTTLETRNALSASVAPL